MQAQGMPVNERICARPQLLSLPMPGPRKACHDNCAEYRPISGRGPADNPASHWGEFVYASYCQVNHDHDERIPPGNEHAPPDMCQHVHSMPTVLARTLLLHGFLLRRALHAVWCREGNRLDH